MEGHRDAKSALARLQTARFDVILCDRNVGSGMSGQDFFHRLGPRDRAHTVMCSGSEPGADDAFAAALGERHFLKRRNVSELVTLLHRIATVPIPTAA